MKQKGVENEARNVVRLDDEGVIVSVLRGRQTADTIRAVSQESARLVADRRAQGKRSLVLSDTRQLRFGDITSGARTESKRQMLLGADATAILSRRGLMSMVLYLQHGNGNHVRAFTNEREARAWLKDHRRAGALKSSASLFAGLLLLVLGILTLAGWQLSNRYLMAWWGAFPPMNPTAAVGLLFGGVGFCCYWFGKLTPLKITGILGILLGVSALLPLHADHLLYSSKLAGYGVSTDIADSAALCFIAWGLSPFTLHIVRARLRRALQYAIAAVLIGLGLFNAFGQMYAHDFMYARSDTFAMTFNLAVAFAAAGAVFVMLVVYRKTGTGLAGRINRMGWLLLAVLVFAQAATYSGWVQSIDRNRTQSGRAFNARVEDVQAVLAQRLSIYLDSLYGFKGLYASSDYVDQGEFDSYYQSLELESKYPGIRALSFISKVPDKSLAAFVAQHKTDKSLYPGGNPAFATPKNNLPTHYILTYVANAAASLGQDLGVQPDRLQAFQRAEQSGAPVSSGTVQFAASAGRPASSGFFLTIPVSNKNSPATIGFVNAVFSYDGFFGNAVQQQKDLLDGLGLRITDASTGSVLYKHATNAPAGKEILHRTVRLPVVTGAWNLGFNSAATFGVGAGQSSLPGIILFSGQLFTTLLLIIFWTLLRSRRQGYQLANAITVDLRHERNTAVAENQKNTAILSSIGDAVFAIDNHKRILLFNPAAQRISGFTEAEVLGRPYDEILRFELEENGQVNRSFITSALGGRLSSMANHTVLIRKDGRRVAVADSAAPIRDASDRIMGAIVVFRDVSKDYELDKAKTEFVSLASHQLRTPLSAINWYGEMLLNGDAGKLTKTQHEYITEIFEGNQRMIELVNSLLDVSRLEVGKLANAPVPTDVNKLISDLEKELAVTIKEKGLKLKNETGDLPPVFADPKQLRMIVQNLLSNAVKYTPAKGTVAVTLRPADAADLSAAQLTHATRPYWYFSVQDTGYGIPKDQQPKIFGKLFRADNVRALDVEGTGLGLYIVKEVVEAMGGRVWFKSIEGAGTTFYVVAPFPEHKHIK
jgi:PAS domain S-box-containing protein